MQQINKLTNSYRLNQTSFSKKTGIAQSNLLKILAGKRTYSNAIINRIIISFDINKYWLETGKEINTQII